MGIAAIRAAFTAARHEHRPAVMPFWPLGFPDVDTSFRVIEAIASAGADMIEIGVPFSDPMADGVVNQRASQVALDRGFTLADGLRITQRLRAAGVRAPLLAMGYSNPIMALGDQAYARAWCDAGADGLIVTDLPPEESGDLRRACDENGLALVQFAAPTSTDDRLRLAAQAATGFVYIVSVAGVTGPRDRLPEGLQAYVERVKHRLAISRDAGGAELPVVVGFGISTPDHVREVGRYADGVIVASALVRAAGDADNPPQVAYDFVRAIKAASFNAELPNL